MLQPAFRRSRCVCVTLLIEAIGENLPCFGYIIPGSDLSRTQLVSRPGGPVGCLDFLFFVLGFRPPNALERWRHTRPIQPYQFRLRVLVLNWPVAGFDKLSELSLRLVGDVRIDKRRGHRRVTIGEKIR